MAKPDPDEVSALRIAAALQFIGNTVRQFHVVGDQAATKARVAKDRRTERHMQSVNRAARNAAIGGEAAIWLIGVTAMNLSGRRTSVKKGPMVALADHKLERLAAAVELGRQGVDDLCFEASALMAYQPQPGREKPKGARKPPSH